MNLYIERLLTHIPGGIPKDPENVPSITINGTGSVTFEGSSLYISAGTSSTRIDLHNKSASQVVQALPSTVTATLEQDGLAELLSLPSGWDYGALPVTLEIAQSGLYFVLGMGARMWESRRRSLKNQVMQMDLQSARGALLDWWGATLDVPRISGEPDLYYAQRINGLRFRPSVNNIAMVDFFSKLGYEASVTDTGYGEFQVRVTLPSSNTQDTGTTTYVYTNQSVNTAPLDGFVYSLTDVEDAVNMLKAAGVVASVFVEGSITDSIAITDSISETLAPATWTVGNVTVGEFIV